MPATDNESKLPRCLECGRYIGTRPAGKVYCVRCEKAFGDDTLAGAHRRAQRQLFLDRLDSSLATLSYHLDRERRQ